MTAFLGKWKTLLLLAALWILFECSMSYFATCNSDHDSNYCSLFRGPVIATSIYFWMQLVDFLREHEHELVAAFTIILALSTIGLWLSTQKLWKVTRITAEHIPRVERAYLFGAPMNIQMNLPGRKTTFDICAHNSGKTPALVKEICVVLSTTGPSGATPNYPNSETSQLVKTDVVINGGAHAVLPVEGRVDQVTDFYAYGYFVYEDIFKERHVSRFSALVHPGLGKLELAGEPAWNDWD
jgi:hypothetical protein